MFPPNPKARGSLKAGTVYAVCGEGDWVYYCQITPWQSAGFLRRRDRSVASVSEVLATPVMSVFGVSWPSIGRAVRSGQWQKIGNSTLVDVLQNPQWLVQWPVGTLNVHVVREDGTKHSTKHSTTIDDPAIQQFEIIGSWDAEYHVPKRLRADFDDEAAEWHVGGPVWRERRMHEELARRFPETWNQLLPGWVPTGLAPVTSRTLERTPRIP